jgi:transposase InsO family protein
MKGDSRDCSASHGGPASARHSGRTRCGHHSFEAYGYRRVTAELRHEGQLVNSKRVRRLMREHGLSPKQRSRYVTTTDSDHDEPILTWRPTRGRERGRCRLNLAQLRNNLLGAPGPAPPGAKQNCQLDQRTALADHVCTRRSERAALRRKYRFGVLVPPDCSSLIR